MSLTDMCTPGGALVKASTQPQRLLSRSMDQRRAERPQKAGEWIPSRPQDAPVQQSNFPKNVDGQCYPQCNIQIKLLRLLSSCTLGHRPSPHIPCARRLLFYGGAIATDLQEDITKKLPVDLANVLTDARNFNLTKVAQDVKTVMNDFKESAFPFAR